MKLLVLNSYMCIQYDFLELFCCDLECRMASINTPIIDILLFTLSITDKNIMLY